MCVECIVVHKKPREGLNYARQAFDDWSPPKACSGCALKASDCKDRAAGPQRSGIRMDVSDRCAPGKMRSRASTSLAPGGLSPEYSMDWPKLRSSTAHSRNCIATSRAEVPRMVSLNCLKLRAVWPALPASVFRGIEDRASSVAPTHE